MAHTENSELAEPDRITIAAVVRAAEWGLLNAVEAGLLIDRLHAHPTTSPSPTQNGRPSGVGGHPGNLSPVGPDRTVR